jgi:hypothetical protein
MSEFRLERQLPEILRWWRQPIPWDPVPDWLFEQVGVDVMRELLVVDLEFQRDMLERQTKALDRKLEILRGAG